MKGAVYLYAPFSAYVIYPTEYIVDFIWFHDSEFTYFKIIYLVRSIGWLSISYHLDTFQDFLHKIIASMIINFNILKTMY